MPEFSWIFFWAGRILFSSHPGACEAKYNHLPAKRVRKHLYLIASESPREEKRTFTEIKYEIDIETIHYRSQMFATSKYRKQQKKRVENGPLFVIFVHCVGYRCLLNIFALFSGHTAGVNCMFIVTDSGVKAAFFCTPPSPPAN